MNGSEISRQDVIGEAVAAAGDDAEGPSRPSRWDARLQIERHRAETERLQLLIEFLTRPIHAHGGSEPDPDIVTAYNLAVEAVLNEVRRAATVQITTG